MQILFIIFIKKFEWYEMYAANMRLDLVIWYDASVFIVWILTDGLYLGTAIFYELDKFAACLSHILISIFKILYAVSWRGGSVGRETIARVRHDYGCD